MKFDDILAFVQAGNSTFTIQSTKIDQRYTYKVNVDKKNEDRFFVKVLFGPENTKDYRFLGWFYTDNLTLRSSIKSCITDPKDPRFTMLKYLLQFLCTNNELPSSCKFYPSGRCGRCGRMLTTPESVERGIGPECYRYVL